MCYLPVRSLVLHLKLFIYIVSNNYTNTLDSDNYASKLLNKELII